MEFEFDEPFKVDGFFNCEVNAALTDLSLPALTTIGHLSIVGNNELTTVNLSNLATARGMSIFVEKLTSLSLPKLVSFAGNTLIVGNDDAGTCE